MSQNSAMDESPKKMMFKRRLRKQIEDSDEEPVAPAQQAKAAPESSLPDDLPTTAVSSKRHNAPTNGEGEKSSQGNEDSGEATGLRRPRRKLKKASQLEALEGKFDESDGEVQAPARRTKEHGESDDDYSVDGKIKKMKERILGKTKKAKKRNDIDLMPSDGEQQLSDDEMSHEEKPKKQRR